MEEFRCVKCTVPQPRTEEYFYRRKDNGRLRNTCILCCIVLADINRSKNPERARESYRRWYARNKVKVQARQRKALFVKAMGK